MSVSPEERRKVFEKGWEKGGGFRFMYETFCDISTNREANEEAASFIRSKIHEIVKDPETARKLTPWEMYARRPLCDSGYYEAFNRDNVELVDVRANPIAEITPKGVKTEDGVEHELDMLIFATGFDAVDGSYRKINFRGRKGLPIAKYWEHGPTSYLGIVTANFPNFFMVLGPGGSFANLPPLIEDQVDFISDIIKYTGENGKVIEVTQKTEDQWMAACRDLAASSLFAGPYSWIFGANIPGKPHAIMFWFNTYKEYRKKLAESTAKNFEGLVVS